MAVRAAEVDRQFKVCDGCAKERRVGQWRVRQLLAGKTRQLGLCDECSLPLRRADMTLEAETEETPARAGVRRNARRRLA